MIKKKYLVILSEDEYDNILEVIGRFSEEAGNQLLNTAHLPETNELWQEDSDNAERAAQSILKADSNVKIYAATINHKHGTNIYFGFSEEQLREQIFDYVSEYWQDCGAEGPIWSYEAESIEVYFESHSFESITWFDPEDIGDLDA